ncbi:MAG: hypothetical protein ACTHU0_28340 [Kofleriaceae bacterium]
MRSGVAIAVPLLFVFACAEHGDDELTEGETSSAIVTHNRLAANRLAANRLAANRLAANRLAANRLELNVNDARELLRTPEGREVLGFIVSCAVKEGDTLVAQFEGNTYEFPGEIGLANDWTHHRLNSEGQGWVSACLFARVNANDVVLPVSMRGPHRQLTATAEEKAGWSLQEGAFYGNYFTPASEPIEWIACRGEAQAAGEIGGLVDRDCAEPDPANPGKTLCGFTYAGDCGDFAEEWACKSYSERGTYYTQCYDEAQFEEDEDHGHHGCRDHRGKHHHHKRSTKYRQVITTWVTPG